MVEMRLTPKGADALRALFQKAPKIVSKHLKKAVGQSGYEYQRVAQEYPPKPPGSTYVRKLSNGLGGAWHTEIKGRGINVRAIVDNPTEYGPYVMGDETQAWMHVGRWRTLTQIAKKLEDKFDKFFQSALRAAIKEMERG